MKAAAAKRPSTLREGGALYRYLRAVAGSSRRRAAGRLMLASILVSSFPWWLAASS